MCLLVAEVIIGGVLMEKIEIPNKLSDEWNSVSEIVVYGFGKVAQRNIGKMAKDFVIKRIIDNSPELEGKSYGNIKITKFSEVSQLIKKEKIIVTTSSFAYSSIRKDLEELGMEEFIDFCRLEDFLPEWYWKNRNQVCLSQVFSSITSRCTFNCKHCNMLMPYYKQHYEYSPDEIEADLALLFQRVDYLTSYFIIGGEPFLHKELDMILERVCHKFGDKIGYIQIITNGSVIPNQNVLQVIEKFGVKVRLSDYSQKIPYSDRLQKVIDILREYNIEYSMGIYKEWMDLGFPDKVPCIGKSREDAKKHMLNCSPGCHIISERKFFYCGLMFSAEKCGLYQLEKDDYIDLRRSHSDPLEDKKEIMKYCLGEIDKGFISICNICRGSGSDNDKIIEVAEQMKPIEVREIV